MKFQITTARAAIFSLVTAFAFIACGDKNDEPQVGDGDISTGDGDGDGDGDTNSDTNTSSNGDGDGDGGGNNGDGDGEGGNNGDGDGDNNGTGGNLSEIPEREDCPDEPDGEEDVIGECWDISNCNGVTDQQFLNQCAGEGTCIGFFDNEDKIEGFEGTLPPLN